MTSSLIQYPTGLITTVNSTVRLRALPRGTRTLPTFTITAATPAAQTITTTAAAAINATSIAVQALTVAIRAGTTLTIGAVAVTLTANAAQGALTLTVAPISGAIASAATGTYTPAANAISNTQVFVSPTPTFIDAGEVLNFGGTTVTVTNQAPVGSRILFCVPLTAAVTNAATATTIALVTLVGCTDASPSASPKTTDATNYTSGAGVEMAVIGSNRTLNVTFNEIEGDLGGIILKQILFNDAHFSREAYFQVARPNGERYEGAAIVTSGDGQAPVQEKVTRSANLQFQGASFVYTPPTADAASVTSIMPVT